MLEPLTVIARGVDARGAEFVTDGSLIARADVLARVMTLAPSPQGVRALGAEQIAHMFASVPGLYTPLGSLTPSATGGWRTADQVELAAGYVARLRALPGTLWLGTAAARAPVWLILDGQPIGALMPLASEPEPEARPAPHVPGVLWAAGYALQLLQRNGLFGEFDRGSFERLLDKVAPAADLRALTGLRGIDAPTLRAMILAHYGLATPAACAARVFALAGTEAPADIAAAAERFAAALGVTLRPASSPPATLGHVADDLQLVLAVAERPALVWIAGGLAPFLLVREDVVRGGPFAAADLWELQPAGAPYLALVAQRLQARNPTTFPILSQRAYPATRLAPAAQLRVIRRVIAGAPEGHVHVVTDGFRHAPLGATGPDAIQRFELVALTHAASDAMVDALAVIGRLLHHLSALAGAAPFELGHALTVPDPLCGATAFYLSRTGEALVTDDAGLVDLVRVTPLSVADRAALTGQPIDAFGGWSYITQLENADFAEVLARWQPPA